MENHLNKNIGLSDVSRENGYSYYHMTRLFSSVLGNPLVDTSSDADGITLQKN